MHSFFAYCKKTLVLFAKSFLVGQSFVYSALIDALYWFITFLTAVTAKNLLAKEVYKLQSVVPTPGILANQTTAETTASMLKWYFVDSGLIIIIAVITQLAIYSLCKGFIWLCLLDKKPTKKYFFGFLKLNILWWLIWLVPALVALFGIKPSFFAPVAVIAFLLYVHLTSILHISFAEKQDIKNAFSKMFSIGIGQIHYFVLPYVLAIAAYWVVSQLFRLLPQDQKSMLAGGIIFLVFFLAWFRGYFLESARPWLAHKTISP